MKFQKICDRKYRSVMFAVFSLIFNLIYAFYNGALGLSSGSSWFITSCVYYLFLCIIRFSALLTNSKKHIKKEYFHMFFAGILLSLLSLVLIFIIYQNLDQNIVTEHGQIVMITIATYTFTKIIMAIIKTVKYRRKNTPLLTVLQNISCAEIAVSVFTMQRSMLVSFGETNTASALILNAFTGAGVCLFTLLSGILLIKKAKKGLKNGNIKNSQSI